MRSTRHVVDPQHSSPLNAALPPEPSTTLIWRYSINSVSFTTWAIASSALRAQRDEIEQRTPSRGSVIFWLQAAPIPARGTKLQRAATAGLDDETATPNRPVRAQCPAIEKVMTQLPASGITAVTSTSTTRSGRASAVYDDSGGNGEHAFQLNDRAAG
ncbi:MAG: hypothetical protein R2855_10095 [Thermomicrobiales bacterium]